MINFEFEFKATLGVESADGIEQVLDALRGQGAAKIIARQGDRYTFRIALDAEALVRLAVEEASVGWAMDTPYDAIFIGMLDFPPFSEAADYPPNTAIRLVDNLDWQRNALKFKDAIVVR